MHIPMQVVHAMWLKNETLDSPPSTPSVAATLQTLAPAPPNKFEALATPAAYEVTDCSNAGRGHRERVRGWAGGGGRVEGGGFSCLCRHIAFSVHFRIPVNMCTNTVRMKLCLYKHSCLFHENS